MRQQMSGMGSRSILCRVISTTALMLFILHYIVNCKRWIKNEWSILIYKRKSPVYRVCDVAIILVFECSILFFLSKWSYIMADTIWLSRKRISFLMFFWLFLASYCQVATMNVCWELFWSSWICCCFTLGEQWIVMAGLEELKKKLVPLFDADRGIQDGTAMDPCASYMVIILLRVFALWKSNSYTLLVLLKVSDGGTVNLLSRSCGLYNINELGLQKRISGFVDETDSSEKTYRCASHEMRVFGAIGCGASSVVQRAIHIPVHRILALKKINIFEKVHILASAISFCK